MAKERGIIRMIINNFINSLRPRQMKGNLMGKDNFGNQFYEIPKGNPMFVNIILIM